MNDPGTRHFSPPTNGLDVGGPPTHSARSRDGEDRLRKVAIEALAVADLAHRGQRRAHDDGHASGQIVRMPPTSMIAAYLEWLLESQARAYLASVETFAASNTFVAICWLNLIRLCTPPTERPQRMDEVERDRNVTVNIGFGNITFCRDEHGAYAHAVVDLAMDLGPQERRENKIEVAMRFSCSPEKESIADLVEQSRHHLLSLLQSAVSHIEKETAESLLYGPEP